MCWGLSHVCVVRMAEKSADAACMCSCQLPAGLQRGAEGLPQAAFHAHGDEEGRSPPSLEAALASQTSGCASFANPMNYVKKFNVAGNIFVTFLTIAHVCIFFCRISSISTQTQRYPTSLSL